MKSDKLQQSYEDTPYPDLCYTQTHPDRLATLATLLGLRPAPITNCRVLELGCAGGGNLIPMAYGLPGSRFVGIDFSAGQIAAGQQEISALALDNISLRHQNILDLAPDFGEFDYIIAHGVYSWVPANVRDRLLAICKGSLATNGIAYVSYNTYPGWHMLSALRNMMLYHTRHTADPQLRVAQARAFLDFLARSVPASQDPYGSFMEAYGNMIDAYHNFVLKEREMEKSGPELLLHDELEEVNEPTYFHEFASHAAGHGLQYLVEADFARVVPTNLPPAVAQDLLKMSHDIVEIEQYMDFVRNRTLRQTLLCHEDVAVQRTLRPNPEQLSALYLATYAQPVDDRPNIREPGIIRYRSPDGALLSIDHPVSKAAMLILAQNSPQAITFNALLQKAAALIYTGVEGGPSEQQFARDALALAANIIKAYSYSMRLVELHVHAPQFLLESGQQPKASAIARHQARAGSQKVTNLRHERVKLDELGGHLLPHLDGRHDRDALLEILLRLAAEGRIRVEKTGEPVTDHASLREILAQELALTLRWLGRAALPEE